MARVGIKDDTSHSKFKDTKVSDFFGIKGGEDSSREKPEQKDTIVDISTESLLKLPPYNRDAESRNDKASQSAIKPSAIDTCTTTVKGNDVKNRSSNGFYMCICCLLAMLVLSKKVENLYFKI